MAKKKKKFMPDCGKTGHKVRKRKKKCQEIQEKRNQK